MPQQISIKNKSELERAIQRPSYTVEKSKEDVDKTFIQKLGEELKQQGGYR